jgi:hypothetical protein
MTKSFATSVIFISMLLIALSYATAFLPGGAPDWAAWVIALSMSALMVAVLILGAAKGGAVRHNGLRAIFVLTFLALAVGFALALRAPVPTPDAPLFLGLPHGAAIIMFVVGFLPMLVLPLAYALTFEETNLSDEELADLRARLKELRP